MGNEPSRLRPKDRRRTATNISPPARSFHESSSSAPDTHSYTSQSPLPSPNLESLPASPSTRVKVKSMSKRSKSPVYVSSPSRHGPNFSWMHNRDVNDINAEANKTLEQCGDEDWVGARLMAEHAAFRIMFNGNYNAPLLEELQNGGLTVLDVGCGVGTWTLEMAADYPYNEFVGIDVKSDLLPVPSATPRNCTFLEGDVTETLPWADATFDFAFVRVIGISLRKDRCPHMLAELARVTKVGGYVEVIELDVNFINAGQEFERWNRAVAALLESRKVNPHVGAQIGAMLSDTPYLVMKKNDSVSAPIGWNGGLGELVKRDVLGFFVSVKNPLLKIIGMTSEEYDQFCVAAVEECGRCETFLTIHYAYAVKTGDL